MPHSDTVAPEKMLTCKQTEAARLLAEGNTAIQAAERVGVSRATMERWKNVPEFRAAIRQMEDTAYAESLRLLKKTARGAISCLICCMSEKVSAYTRVAAASKLLDLGLEVHKVGELEKEIAELKQLITGGREHGNT